MTDMKNVKRSDIRPLSSVIRSSRDLFARGLRQKSRTRQTAPSRRCINLFDKAFVERYIDSYGASGVGQQRHCHQKGACFRSFPYILVAQNIICRASRGHRVTCAFKGFDVLTQGRHCICRRLFQSIASRKATVDIRKPDAVGAVTIFLCNRYVLFRHSHTSFLNRRSCSDRLLQTPSQSPSRQLIDPPNKPDRQVFSWVSHCNDDVPIRVFESVVIAAHAILDPSILQQSVSACGCSFPCDPFPKYRQGINLGHSDGWAAGPFVPSVYKSK